MHNWKMSTHSSKHLNIFNIITCLSQPSLVSCGQTIIMPMICDDKHCIYHTRLTMKAIVTNVSEYDLTISHDTYQQPWHTKQCVHMCMGTQKFDTGASGWGETSKV